MTSRERLHAARSAAARLADLLHTEQHAMADFLLALSAFDAARGWAELGHASLFAFLIRHLHLSKSAAFHRAAAARLVRQYPSVAAALRAGQLCLSSTAELAKVLTPENQAAVLPRFFGLSAREARELVAELAPHPSPPLREVVRAVAPAVPSSAEVVLTSEPALHATQREQGTPLPEAAPPHLEMLAEAPPTPPVANPAAPARPADEATPLTTDLRRLHVTVSRRFLQKLEAARQARAHAQPDATTEALLEEALDLLLAREEKRRAAATPRPRHGAGGAGGAGGASPGQAVSSPREARLGFVPAHVRREVWARDEGRCQWPIDGGGICGSTHRLQLDHARAKAQGGEATAANMRVLCEAHNKESARRTFGAEWMEKSVGRERLRTG